jgi:hypothetical protein
MIDFCQNCYKDLSSYEKILNSRYKSDKVYCKECMFSLKPIVENKYDLEKLALEKKGYESWSEWGEYRRDPKKYVKYLANRYGIK